MTIFKTIALVLIASFATMTTASAQSVDEWRAAINKQIAKKQSYPRAAIRKEIEGKARIEIVIDRKGNIVDHTILTSTGAAVLDREIPKLMKRVSPVDAPPASLTVADLTIVLPIAWRLE